MIKYHVENVRKPKFYRNIFSDWIAKVAHTYGKKIGEINYIFCDDEKILENLNVRQTVGDVKNADGSFDITKPKPESMM